MRRIGIILLLTVLSGMQVFAYNDYRGHNLDSLERTVARWTPDAIDKASDTDLVTLNRAYRDLMLGYSALNSEKCVFYARKALSISEPRGWEEANADACRYIGQCFWAEEQYDSSLFYYRKALSAVERMAGGATSPTNPEGYSERDVDDTRSALYGAIGNLYNMMDSIPQAMQWYGKAGAIFDRYGWRQSNAILYYNIGETWVEQGELRKASQAYEKALAYAQGDSLMVAIAQKGLGRVYMEEWKTWKALRYLHQADAYFSAHDKEELTFTKENYEYMSAALLAQRRQMMLLGGGAILLLLLLLAVLLIGRKLRRSRKEQAEVSAVLEETIEGLRPAEQDSKPLLNEQEKAIARLLVEGKSTKEIADAVNLGVNTVLWYRKRLYAKFDVHNAAAFSTEMSKRGILD